MIIPFDIQYFNACLRIFDSNKPRFFREDERLPFIDFLEKLFDDQYFVLKHKEEIIACGGIYEYDENTIGLAWGMVLNKYHGQGFGTALTRFRIDKMKTLYPDYTYKVETSQLTQEFYSKMGFKLSHVIKDGFGLGLDKVVMIYRNPN